MITRKRAGVLAGLVAAALIAIGCGGGEKDTGDVSSDTVTGTSASAAAKGPAKMGTDKVTFPGAVIRTSKPAKFAPSSTAFGYTRGQQVFAVDVTVENTGGEPIDLAMITVRANIGPNGTQTMQVMDSEKNVLGFSGTVPAGGKSTTKFVFAADGAPADLKKLTVTVEPSLWGSEVATFTGAL